MTKREVQGMASRDLLDWYKRLVVTDARSEKVVKSRTRKLNILEEEILKRLGEDDLSPLTEIL